MPEPLPTRFADPDTTAPLRVSIDVDDRREDRRVIRMTAWLDPPSAVVREGPPNAPIFEYRSTREVFFRLDHAQQQCFVQVGRNPDQNYWSAVSPIVGPAAFVYEDDFESGGFVLDTSNQARKYQSNDVQAAVRRVWLGTDHFPRSVSTDEYHSRWRILRARAAARPRPPTLSGWRVESAEFSPEEVHPAIRAAMELATEPPTVVRIRSTANDDTREHALLQVDGQQARVTVRADTGRFADVLGEREIAAVGGYRIEFVGPVDLEGRMADLRGIVALRADADYRSEGPEEWWDRITGLLSDS